MDVHLLEDSGKKEEYYVFIDSEDQRLYKNPEEFISIARGSHVKQTPGTTVYEIDTAANRINFVFDYTVTFQEPYKNVVSVEIVDAHIPTAPLKALIEEGGSNDTSLLRYITVVCPDVDTHLKKNKRKINYATSMAKICWESLDNRTYIRYEPRMKARFFHPIGKLHRLRFQFFRNNTDTYVDFAGSHHTMVVKIVCLELPMEGTREYLLNPSYDPREIPNPMMISGVATSDEEEDV